MKLEHKHLELLNDALGIYGQSISQGIIELEKRAIIAEQELKRLQDQAQKQNEFENRIDTLPVDTLPVKIKKTRKKREKKG